MWTVLVFFKQKVGCEDRVHSTFHAFHAAITATWRRDVGTVYTEGKSFIIQSVTPIKTTVEHIDLIYVPITSQKISSFVKKILSPNQ